MPKKVVPRFTEVVSDSAFMAQFGDLPNAVTIPVPDGGTNYRVCAMGSVISGIPQGLVQISFTDDIGPKIVGIGIFNQPNDLGISTIFHAASGVVIVSTFAMDGVTYNLYVTVEEL